MIRLSVEAHSQHSFPIIRGAYYEKPVPHIILSILVQVPYTNHSPEDTKTLIPRSLSLHLNMAVTGLTVADIAMC